MTKQHNFSQMTQVKKIRLIALVAMKRNPIDAFLRTFLFRRQEWKLQFSPWFGIIREGEQDKKRKMLYKKECCVPVFPSTLFFLRTMCCCVGQIFPSYPRATLRSSCCKKEKSSQTGRVFSPPTHWGFAEYEAGKTCESIKTRPIRENATVVVCLIVMLPPLFPAVKKVLTLLPPSSTSKAIKFKAEEGKLGYHFVSVRVIWRGANNFIPKLENHHLFLPKGRKYFFLFWDIAGPVCPTFSKIQYKEEPKVSKE